MSQEIIRSYKTKGIKELQTYIKQGTSHYALQWSDGGQLPAELGGLFTSLNTVNSAVLTYINNQSNTKQERKSQEI